MSFPTTGLLDDFNRADADPIDGSWSSPLYQSETGLRIVSGAIDAAISSGRNSYYSAAQYGPDCEVYAKLTQQSTGGGSARIFARIINPNTPNLSGYRLVVFQGGSGPERIQRIDNGTAVTLGADMTETVSDGDLIGLECLGSAIRAYLFTGGSWQLLGTRIDTTYAGAGYLGVEQIAGTGSANIMDDFGGGTIASLAILHPPHISTGIVTRA